MAPQTFIVVEERSKLIAHNIHTSSKDSESLLVEHNYKLPLDVLKKYWPWFLQYSVD